MIATRVGVRRLFPRPVPCQRQSDCFGHERGSAGRPNCWPATRPAAGGELRQAAGTVAAEGLKARQAIRRRAFGSASV